MSEDLTPLQTFVARLAMEAGISPAVMAASNHDYYCRCDQCKEWWREVGPEENGTFGPFTSEEIRNNV